MLRKLLLSVVIVLFANVVLLAQNSGALKGKLKDAKSGEPIPFANIVVERGGQLITGSTTDFDGNYTIKPLSAGRYDVKATYVGYHPMLVQGLIISPGKTTYQDFELKSAMEQLEVIEVVSYRVKLIDKDKTTSGETVTAEDIDKMPGRDATSIAATVGGVYTQDGSDDMNIRGSRAEATAIYVDGVKVVGGANVPKSAVDQVSVVTSGLPAKYGDATGGVVSITTKGPSKEFGGGVELVTSEFLDDFGYNLAAFSMRGPLITKQLETRKESIVGFFFSGEALYERDDRPFVDGLYKATDAYQAEVEANPFIQGIGSPTNPRIARTATADKFEKVYKKEDAAVQGFNVAGKFDIKPAESNFNITLGGSYDFSNRRIFSIRNSLFNSDNNGDYTESTWRTYARFTQRFNDPKATENKESEPVVKNVYYSIQVDYSKNTRTWQDYHHKDNLFAYGHVAKTKRQIGHNYSVEDSGTENIYYYTEYDENKNPTDSMRIQNAHIYTGLTDSADIKFDDELKINENLYNYMYQYYNDPSINANFGNYNFLAQGGALMNGDMPSRIYDMYNAPGTVYNFYQLSDRSIFSVSANGSADIRNHAIEFGIKYEQSTDRAFAVGDPTGLWDLMGQLVNKHNQALDLYNPIVSYYDRDTNGTLDTVIRYNFQYESDNQATFDRNLRMKLGKAVDATGALGYIDINDYDPSTYSLDMFSADELLNDGNSYVTYFGYDYKGDKLTSKPSFEDFFTEVDANGDFTRPVGAYEPIYMAGYIQDKFEIDDLIFNVGLRVDRFDANQYVLKDPYLLYSAYTVGEKRNAIGADDAIAVSHPDNIGDDYVIYVNNIDNPSQIIAYRDGDNWYNAEGTEMDDVISIRGLNPKPYVKNVEQTKDYPTIDAFEDYEPQTTFMPRVAFSFPISDEANFYAHYDVITQRPMGDNRMDVTDFYYINKRAIGGAAFSNPNLKPEKMINYQLGFQQKVSVSSAITLETFVRDIRDQRQIHYYVEAFPTPYYSYTNKDFGTVKGFNFKYDLRRTGNVRVRANYSLQFAEGTGSDPNTSAALVRAGQPNLRTILPLNHDSRHTFNLIFDFRYGEGDDYNGPVIGNTQILKKTGVNLAINARSGSPYSKSSKIYSTYVGQGQSVLEGSMNGSRMPWQYTVNAKIDRDFKLKFGKDEEGSKKKETYLNAYIEIFNLLDTKNVMQVYNGTGDPDDDGFLYDVESQNFIESRLDEQVFRTLYSMRMANPYFYGFPRRIRFGVSFNF